MKNIAILIQCLYGGGAERIAGLLSKHLVYKYNIYLFMVDTSNIVYDYAGMLVDLSINGEEQIESTMKEFKKKYNIDCAISFLEPMNFMNIRTRERECVVISERCAIGEMVPYPYGDSVKIKQWYNYADKIISVAHGVEYDLRANFGINKELITTIYNFIDKEKIINKSSEKLEDEVLSFIGNSKVILNVGRMDPQKNQIKLLVQFEKLVRRGYDIKLIIVGKGMLESKLCQWIQKLELENYVKLITYHSNPFPYYKIAKMMVLSSDYEGLPNVVLESFLLGTPVVSVDCLSGPRELLMNSYEYNTRIKGCVVCDNGVLVEKCKSDETGKTEYLASAMEILLNNEKVCQRIIKNSTNYIRQYSNEKIEDAWIDVIEKTQISKEVIPILSPIISLDRYKKVIVFGAGVYGKLTMSHLLQYKGKFELLCFAVSKKRDNESIIFDVPVYEIQELVKYKKEAIVLVGVSYTFEKAVTEMLDELGFEYIFPIC